MASAMDPSLKRDLHQLRCFLGVPEDLYRRGTDAENQGLGQIEFRDAHQNEQEVHRHRAGHARQRYLQPGGNQGQEKVAQEARADP